MIPKSSKVITTKYGHYGCGAYAVNSDHPDWFIAVCTCGWEGDTITPDLAIAQQEADQHVLDMGGDPTYRPAAG